LVAVLEADTVFQDTVVGQEAVEVILVLGVVQLHSQQAAVADLAMLVPLVPLIPVEILHVEVVEVAEPVVLG
jgi:hypothetical protein